MGGNSRRRRRSAPEIGEARGADWARAKWLLHDAFGRRVGRTANFEIGWVRFLGDGLCRKAFIAEVSLSPDPEDLSDNYVVLLPLPDAESSYDERAWFEARLLTRLASLDLPLRIPRIWACSLTADGRRSLRPRSTACLSISGPDGSFAFNRGRSWPRPRLRCMP
jgi:hypothetical protein